MRFAEFDLDEANACLLRSDKPVALAPTPFNLLCALARQPGALLTKDALLDAVWGHQFVTESVLKTAISDLRTALGDSPREPRFIETVSRRGYRFIAVPAAAPAAPPVAVAVPAGQRPSPSFIGRADAMARLQRAWEQACNGQRAVVWVAGEPGIGKTTLIEHFVASLGGTGMACARGQCVEHYGTGEPYLPGLEALAELCREDRTLPALLRSVAPTWLLQLPWLSSAEERDALRRELAGVGPDRMLREMGELLDRYTEQRPLLLVTEDLHWSDRATLQLIDHVARRRGRARLMWLASFRLAEVIALDHPLNPLRHELRLQRLCQEVVLDPFSETEVADCIAQRSPSLARDEAFVRALHARTDGVPLFVSSVIAEVLERTADNAAVEQLAAMAVPENLAAIIDHHIARLDTEPRALLSAAAVCGVEFRVDTLALALERDAASVAEACEAMVREQVWLAAPRAAQGDAASEPPYAFRHALFRQVLYERTVPAARMQLHRKVGAALERERSAGVPVAAAELAMHFDRGRQPMTALRHYAEAAQAALLNFSPASCLGLTERALALLPQAPPGADHDAIELVINTLHGAAAFQSLGAGSVARNAFERAYTLLPAMPGHTMRGRLLYGFGYVLSLRCEYAQALAVAESAGLLASASNDPALHLVACIVHGQVHHVQGRPQAALDWFERGLAAAEPLGREASSIFVVDTRVTLHGLLALQFVQRGQVAQARAHSQRARERAAELRHPMTRLDACWRHALLEVRLGSTERIAALAEEMQDLVDEFSLAQGQTACRWFRGLAQALNGAPREGHRLIRDAFEENTRLGMRSGGSEVLGYAANALLLAGDHEAARTQIEEALQLADELAERVYQPQLWLLEGAIHRAQGRAAAGAASARRAIEEARAQQAPWLELLALVDLCEHHDAAAAERSALAALVDRLPEAGDTVPARRAIALVQAAKPA